MENSQLSWVWSSAGALNYFLMHRDSIDDLYCSEKHFIEYVMKSGKSVLDIGCATGGFSKIVKKYNKGLDYTGVDISPAMIEEAKKRFPQEKFYLCDGQNLDFPDESFDICISFGVLHMTERWEKLFSEAWRVCRVAFLFDLRTVDRGGICDAKLSYQRIEFDGQWDGVSKVPYVIVNLEDAIRYMMSLNPKIKSLKTYGYWHPVSETAVTVFDTVCMSVFYLKKKGLSEGIDIDWQLPLVLPEQLRQGLSR